MAVVESGATAAGSSADGLCERVMGEDQLTTRMGIEITEWNPDRLVATMPVLGNLQPHGLLHGGANAVLAETLGSIAAELHAGPDRQALGLDLSCTHHRPARGKFVTGTATPMRRGRTIATYEITITDERGNRTCSARLTCVLRDQPRRYNKQ